MLLVTAFSGSYASYVQADTFDEAAFFRALTRSNARALLIGRRALVALGLPVMTADYDFWIHVDDIEKVNEVAASFDMAPNRSPEQARRSGRYVLENGEHVDVMVARTLRTLDGTRVPFDALWNRRRQVDLGYGAYASIPSIPDLVLTKRVTARPRDAEDIRMLQALDLEESGDE